MKCEKCNINEAGFNTKSQVIPDQCKDWNKPFYVDLIVWNEHITIGIEGKCFKSLRQRGKISKTVKQVCKYNKETSDKNDTNTITE
jgi:hypothetical protein